MLKLLIATVVTAVSIFIPLYASESIGGNKAPEASTEDHVVVLYDLTNQSSIATLEKTDEMGRYSGVLSESNINEHVKFNLCVQVDGKLYRCTYKGKWQYSDDAWEETLKNTTFLSTNTDGDGGIEFDKGGFPYEQARFTVTLISEEELTLEIEDVPIIPDPPVAGSTITVKNLLYEDATKLVSTSELVNTDDDRYVFTGSIPKIEQYSSITFSFNGNIYGCPRTEYDSLPEEVTLSMKGSGNVYYKGNGLGSVGVKVTLSEDQKSMTVRFLQVTPLSVLVDGKETQLCEDINELPEGTERVDWDAPVQVQEGGSSNVAVKIGDKTYGVADNAIEFDAENRDKQVKESRLVENGNAITLNQKGIYTVAVLLGADGYKLQITKAAAGNEMNFGEGNGLVFNEDTSEWTGAVELKANTELPALTYTVYGADGNATTTTYYFPSDIDDPDGQDHTVELTTKQPSTTAKSVTVGTYKLSVKIAADGTATATYRNTTPPVKLDDLYVCVYDKHLYPNTENGYGYNTGESFSVDYKVTHRLADGSYAVAICMNNSQAFYIMNNGIAYRPAMKDMWEAFGSSKDGMKSYTFTPSEDHSLRKHVSTDPGYRMLIISPDGSNISVKGYLIPLGTDEYFKKNCMNVVESLTNPVNTYGHMADVIIKFTNPNPTTDPDNTQGYRTDYCKVPLNPSGTHGLYDVTLKAGQTFEIYRGRAIYGDDGKTVIGIEDKDKVQYGCGKNPAEGKSSVTITDGDISTLYDEYNSSDCKTKTYSVVRDGEFSFMIFYTTLEKQLTVSRKVKKDRGIKIAVYDKDGNLQGDLVDMQYKNTNRRNLMSVQVPKGGYVKFGFINKNGELDTFNYYNLGHSNKAGYDTKPAEGQEQESQFNAIDGDYSANTDKVWYRFRIRLREDGNYYLTYQNVPMPSQVWLYVTSGSETREYTAYDDKNNPGHFVFTGVDIPQNAEYYFVNRQNGKIDNNLDWEEEDPTDGLIWYCAHTSSHNGITEGNPVIPGRWINMFSHLNVGTDYQSVGNSFNKFKYSEEKSLSNVTIDMDIATMSHRYSVDYIGQSYYFEGCCAGVQGLGKKDWNKQNERYKFVYHPTTGYYTCYLEYLWGDWFIYNYNTNGSQQTDYYSYNLNNVVHELNQPYYLSDANNRYISDAKMEIATGTAADTQIQTKDANGNAVIPKNTYKDRFMIALAPGAISIIQTSMFQNDWVHSPVYKDVTVVFDPANNVLWLMSGHVDGDPEANDPYGELYLIFTDVTPEEWAQSRIDEENDPDSSDEIGKHWVKLNPDPDQIGRYTANNIDFPARLKDGKELKHSSYFFSNRLGKTLAETIRYSNSYHAGIIDPVLDSDQMVSEDEKYGSVYTKLVYDKTGGSDNSGSFKTVEKPMSLINTSATAYAKTIYVRRWDNKEGAPYEDCYVPGTESGSNTTARRTAVRRDVEADNSGSNGGGATSGGNIFVTTTDDEPDLGDTDFVVRTFASEPYTYDVVVHLGRQEFTLETSPKDIISSSVEELSDDVRPAAVIRAVAGHISVTGAESVSIYTVTGRCLLLDAPGAELDVDPGVYIIVADGKASKHIL